MLVRPVRCQPAGRRLARGRPRAVVDGSLTEHDFIAYLLDDGVVRAAVSIGRPREIRTARAWIADQARLADVRVSST
ncbi:oxidoreductase C-terminal domain-containing protein [Aeromicrobium sp. UC242_57]|uniref:oxidoreductase C-terminal domain-containing protein n=1 Tax=Aeromicrobium sp. UC242_57 TaxID=3374624 RepID=UPI0037BA19D2